MKQPAKVVMLPTENYSSIVHSTNKYGGLFESRHYSPMKDMGDSYQHLYILSDEEIKDGDWVLTPENKILKFGQVGTYLSKDKKIIATTDISMCEPTTKAKDITYKQYPKIPESFIKAYIKAYNEGNPITEVQVEYETITIPCPDNKVGCLVHHMKDVLKLKEDGSIIIHRAKMYTEEYTRSMVKKAYNIGLEAATTIGQFDIDKWIKENL